MTEPNIFERDFSLEEVDPRDFFGVNNANIDLMREAYPGVRFSARGTALKAFGEPEKLAAIHLVVESILREIRKYGPASAERVRAIIARGPSDDAMRTLNSHGDSALVIGVDGGPIRPKTDGQIRLVDAIDKNDLVFAIGPAGSGKTYVAVAAAVRALKQKQVIKIILARPAVEAGERLGFLPGDMKEKIDPYLRPLYDALEDMIPHEKLKHFLERGVIEIAPLAFMRGRTLNHAFVILDEAQNATEMQLKMFLTRMGPEAKFVVTGDLSQIDLPRSVRSGLVQGVRLLENIDGIGIVRFNDRDVVRHPLIKRIILAYEQQAAERTARSEPAVAPEPETPPVL